MQLGAVVFLRRMLDQLKRAAYWLLSFFLPSPDRSVRTVSIHQQSYKVIKKIGEGNPLEVEHKEFSIQGITHIAGGFSYVFLVKPLRSSPSRGASHEEGGEDLEELEGGRGKPLYALKRLRIQTEEQEQSFRKEMQAHRLVANHPNVISLVDGDISPANSSGIREGLLLYPFYTRGTLQDRIDKTKYPEECWAVADLVRILDGICAGLLAFHQLDPPMAFRDLKPANVLLDSQDRPVLMDLGSVAPAVVQITNRKEALALQEVCAETCTAPYRPPELFEVASSVQLDARTDTWSLGCTLFTATYGKMAFDGSATAAISGRIPFPASPPFRTYPAAYVKLLERMLAVDVSQRLWVAEVQKEAKLIATTNM